LVIAKIGNRGIEIPATWQLWTILSGRDAEFNIKGAAPQFPDYPILAINNLLKG
jgi:hypothetical protein